MPPLRQVFKSLHSPSGIKSRLKTLLGKSGSSLPLSKPASNPTFTAGVLPSTSFRSFQCEISRFSSRTWEVGDSEKPLTMSEAVSRMLAIPSVHGPVWQSFGYRTHQILDENPFMGSRESVALQCRIMKTKHVNVETKFMFALESLRDDSTSVISISPKQWKDMKNPLWEEDMDILGIKTCKQIEITHIPKIDWRCEAEEELDLKDIRECEVQVLNLQMFLVDFYDICTKPCPSAISSTFWNMSAGVCDIKQQGLIFDAIPEDTQLVAGEKAPARTLNSKGLRLLSGACYFPHPDKEVTGGEDAYFICADKQVFGVADGVGGWADLGVDSGEYARQLMRESLIAAREEPTGCVDAARVLEKAYLKTTCRGSSTACILALSDNGLQAVNLGDSGFLVVRNGRMIFKSPAQQHTFNLPFQLESSGGGDPVSSAEIFVVEVAAGDVIIAGTDGLFDNLYAAEMTGIVVQATRSGLSPDVAAQNIAHMARERAKDRNRQTPFSAAAQDAGFRFYGGKMDDITVIVSYVRDCSTSKGD